MMKGDLFLNAKVEPQSKELKKKMFQKFSVREIFKILNQNF